VTFNTKSAVYFDTPYLNNIHILFLIQQ